MVWANNRIKNNNTINNKQVHWYHNRIRFGSGASEPIEVKSKDKPLDEHVLPLACLLRPFTQNGKCSLSKTLASSLLNKARLLFGEGEGIGLVMKPPH